MVPVERPASQESSASTERARWFVLLDKPTVAGFAKTFKATTTTAECVGKPVAVTKAAAPVHVVT